MIVLCVGQFVEANDDCLDHLHLRTCETCKRILRQVFLRSLCLGAVGYTCYRTVLSPVQLLVVNNRILNQKLELLAVRQCLWL